jgi:death-on-curing protein
MAEGDGGQIDQGWLDEFVELLIDIHDAILHESGGLPGVHMSALLGAAARPFHSAFGKFVYTGQLRRAAALFHGIICDHAFVDGNKRTATVAVTAYLAATGYRSASDPNQLQIRMLGEVALDTAEGHLDVDQVAFWLGRIFGNQPPQR